MISCGDFPLQPSSPSAEDDMLQSVKARLSALLAACHIAFGAADLRTEGG